MPASCGLAKEKVSGVQNARDTRRIQVIPVAVYRMQSALHTHFVSVPPSSEQKF